MSDSSKKILKETYNKLKKVVKKVIYPGNEPQPQLVLQPYRTKKYF